eukprot:NODE_81_length_3780_cov_20.253764.p1 GENE.NODE_81_length_3780_cov_20.253764~~NODE_81_length_3780_cov_20.253764.p1  ORF type:complete len:915 (+),score=172.14 NODE_81_length_3780_cov_20.253764:654-3398(+)
MCAAVAQYSANVSQVDSAIVSGFNQLSSDMSQPYVATSAAVAEAYLNALIPTLVWARYAEILNYDQSPWTYVVETQTSLPSIYTATDEELQAAISQDCYMWDGGLYLPPDPRSMVKGGYWPRNYDDEDIPMEGFAVAGSIMFAQDWAKMMQATVAFDTRPNGAINITEAQGLRAMERWIEVLQDYWNVGYNDDSEDLLNVMTIQGGSEKSELTSTLNKLLEEYTSSAGVVTALYIVTTFVLSLLLFIRKHRRIMSPVFVPLWGTFLVFLATAASFGLTALFGVKLNVLHFWFLSFLLTGVGMDDLFFVVGTARGKETDVNRFAEAMADVMVPVTITSAINCGSFLVLYLYTSIPVIFNICFTGAIGMFVTWAVNIFSLSPFAFYELKRKLNGRSEIAACSKRAEFIVHDVAFEEYSFGLFTSMKTNAYIPMLKNKIFRMVCIVCYILLGTVIAVTGLSDIGIGLNLKDVCAEGDVCSEWARLHWDYFGAYPVQLEFKQLAYNTGEGQLLMAIEWDKLLRNSFVDSYHYNLRVWPSYLAQWALPATDIGNSCSETACGPTVNASCTATWKATSYEFRTDLGGDYNMVVDGADFLAADPSRSAEFQGGTLYYPVFEADWDTFAYCYGLCVQDSSYYYKMLSTRNSIGLDANSQMITPIKYSSAGDVTLYASGLTSEEDYITFIEDTRAVVDDDDRIPSFMDGTPFSYFEQGLTIVQDTFTSAAVALLVGFFVSFALFAINAKRTKGYTNLNIFIISFGFASLLVAVGIASVVMIMGLLSLLNINMTIFSLFIVVMNVAFAVEFNVHTAVAFIDSSHKLPLDRMQEAVSHVFEPHVMGVVTTLVCTVFIGSSQFSFIRKYMFLPLFCTMLITIITAFMVFPSIMSFLPFRPQALMPTKTSQVDAVVVGNPVTMVADL